MIKILKYGEVSGEELFARSEPTFDVTDIVTDIIENVAKNGDKALFEYSKKFDKADLTALEVTEEEIRDAFEAVEPEFLRILEQAAKNIRAFFSGEPRNRVVWHKIAVCLVQNKPLSLLTNWKKCAIIIS